MQRTRAGRATGEETIGRDEWYPAEAALLLDRQGKNGAWVGDGPESDPRIATSFALLFLTADP